MGASLRHTRSLRNGIGRKGFELGSGYVAVDYSVRMKHCILSERTRPDGDQVSGETVP